MVAQRTSSAARSKSLCATTECPGFPSWVLSLLCVDDRRASGSADSLSPIGCIPISQLNRNWRGVAQLGTSPAGGKTRRPAGFLAGARPKRWRDERSMTGAEARPCRSRQRPPSSTSRSAAQITARAPATSPASSNRTASTSLLHSSAASAADGVITKPLLARSSRVPSDVTAVPTELPPLEPAGMTCPRSATRCPAGPTLS